MIRLILLLTTPSATSLSNVSLKAKCVTDVRSRLDRMQIGGSLGSRNRFRFRSLSCREVDRFYRNLLLVREGSGCLCLVFVSLDTVRS